MTRRAPHGPLPWRRCSDRCAWVDDTVGLIVSDSSLQVQFWIRDRKALAAWIRRRIVAHCPTSRLPNGSPGVAAGECGLSTREFYDLLGQTRGGRPRRRFAPEIFHRLLGTAFRLSGREIAVLRKELLPRVLAAPPG